MKTSAVGFAIAGAIIMIASTAFVSGPGGFRARSVRGDSLRYHLAWSRQLDNIVDSTPVIERNVKMAGGKRATVAFALAGNNGGNCDPGSPVRAATTYAFTISTGKLLWRRSTSGRGRCTTAAPAIWSTWVFSPGLDGKIHKYSAATGSEWKRGGWPKPFTKQPYVEKSSANLRVTGRYLYLATSGFIGDAGHYQGHLVTVNLLTGHESVWNSLCSNIHALINNIPNSADYCPDAQNGMFGRGQAVTDPLNGDVYVVTGNGPWNGRTNWGDSILKITPDGSKLVDAFTPANQQYLNVNDLDLGSTGSAILPPITVRGRIWHLLLQGGKGPAASGGGPAVIWLVNRDQMGSSPGPGHLGGSLDRITAPGGSQILTAPAVWIDPQGRPIVIYANDSGVVAYGIRTSGARPKLSVLWSLSGRSTSPVISGNTLFIAHDNEVDAYNPASGHRLWSSANSGSGGSIGGIHWSYPAVYGGWLLVTDQSGKLYAYKRR